jgi:DNA/RNA endonuclease YhcR with UshA esterase domain
MRWVMPAICCLLVCVPFTLADDETKALGPVEAAKKVNEEVTVRMEVKSANLRGSVCFLNSEEDFKNANNLTLFIDKDALAKFKEAKIDDPAAYFKGKTVEVKGKVTLYREHPEIKLSGPDVVKIVDKK